MRRNSIPCLRRRLTVMAVLVALLSGLTATTLGMMVANLLLRPELDATGFTVANGLARDLVYAYELGIPFDDYLGMDDYLRNVVEDAPSVRAVTVRANDGRTLYQYGGGGTWSLYDVAMPLVTDGKTIGQVQVSLDRLIYLSYTGPEFTLIMAISLALALAAAWITAGLAAARVFEPLGSASRILIRGAQGDFRTAPRRTGLGPPRAVTEATATVIERLRHNWQSLRERAMAARAAHFDPAVMRRIDAVTEELRGHYQLPVEDTAHDVGLAARGGLQLVLFLLVTAEAVCTTVVAPYPLLIATTWGAAILAAALPARLIPVSGRSAIISGTLVAALGYVVTAGLDAGTGQVSVRLVVGLGLGTALRGIGDQFSQWRGLLAIRPSHQAILSGCIVGPVLGGLLAAEVTNSAPYALAAFIATAAVVIGRWLPSSPVSTGPTARMFSLMLAMLLGGAAALLGQIPHPLAVLWPGWPVEALGGLLASLAAACLLTVLAVLTPRRAPRC